jgi:hypothetical protein
VSAQQLPPTVTVYVNNQRLADGAPADPLTAPTALSGLKVTWGRGNSLDQPRSASCTFDVMDLQGGQKFLERLWIGAQLDVDAFATLWPDPSLPTFTDGSFEAQAVGPLAAARWDGSKASVYVETAPYTAPAGTKYARVETTGGPGIGTRVTFPPKPFGAFSSWDTLPITALGQTWSWSLSVRVLAGQLVTVIPVLFTGPTKTDTRYAVAAPVNAVGTGAWETVTGRFTATVAGCWVGLDVQVGAGPAWDQVPASATWDSRPATLRWDDEGSVLLDQLQILAPATGAERTGRVFSGYITDLSASYDTDVGGTVIKVVAQDVLAELSNRIAGDIPWPQETVAVRVKRILDAVSSTFPYSVDAVAAAVVMASKDVDAQPAGDLLGDASRTAGAALWVAAAVSTGSFLRIEDVDSRPATQVIQKDGDGVVRIHPKTPASFNGVVLSACDVELEPVVWNQTSREDSNVVAVQWIDAVTTPGQWTQKTVTLTNQISVDATGTRRVSISTELATSAAASELAGRVMARTSSPGWRIGGLQIDLRASEPVEPDLLALVMTVLDGTTRIGLPILITDLPDWSPISSPGVDVPCYLEGGAFSNEKGAWTLDLVTSDGTAHGASSYKWDQSGASWQWDQFDPAISWDDLRGVSTT